MTAETILTDEQITEQADFEAWTGYSEEALSRSAGDDGYCIKGVDNEWRAYQAGRAALQSQDREGWKEAAIAWEVCASIHREWAKGKDALFNTRQADFTRHAEEARAAYRATEQSPEIQALREDAERWRLFIRNYDEYYKAGYIGGWALQAAIDADMEQKT